jgi:hypothetical protein
MAAAARCNAGAGPGLRRAQRPDPTADPLCQRFGLCWAFSVNADLSHIVPAILHPWIPTTGGHVLTAVVCAAASEQVSGPAARLLRRPRLGRVLHPARVVHDRARFRVPQFQFSALTCDPSGCGEWNYRLRPRSQLRAA